YGGAIEVELFNEVLWGREGVEVLRETVGRYLDFVFR
ncbi:sugar phosphate isomerase/epimerase, partial [Streptomyces lunaelactis]|nr:sugar phosphate isomerase/epimerase [Streptomyces lunaelactis]